MKIMIIAMGTIFTAPIIGFIGQWLRWVAIPTWKDKKNSKKVMKNT